MRRLDAVYEKLRELYTGDGVSAIEIAEALKLNRANVSSDLNRLFEAGKVSKVNGRPVLFSPVRKTVFKKYNTAFDDFAKENPTLFSAVEQAKAAVMYPPKGMHVLIFGETGVGKSMFAELIYDYAVEMGKMDKNSSIITFNCADYASNPHLLISQLFGVKKGSYTGADFDKSGLIEKADGGILFLDEVHRLPPEGQEMFFDFMDKGFFRRLGETSVQREAKVMILCATTENPNSALLKTFIRRFPMIVILPELSHRSYEERLGLINKFFVEESIRFDNKIMVSIDTIRALLSYRCNHNIGQLKNDIQLICARAYLQFISENKAVIRIDSDELPEHIKEGLYNAMDYGFLESRLQVRNGEYYIFNSVKDYKKISRKVKAELALR